jgi:hypothetical protein
MNNWDIARCRCGNLVVILALYSFDLGLTTVTLTGAAAANERATPPHTPLHVSFIRLHSETRDTHPRALIIFHFFFSNTINTLLWL